MISVACYYGDTQGVEQVVDELRGIMRQTGLARTLAVGQIVLDRFFGGSTELWQDRRRNKNNSIRRLADCPTCPLSRSALNQAVGVFAALRNMPGAADLQHIGASHIAVVLTLPDDAREAWLIRANDQLWSVRRLSDEIRGERRLMGERRGRPARTLVAKVLGRVNAALDTLEREARDLLALDFKGPELAEVADRLTGLEVLLKERAGRRESVTVAKVSQAEVTLEQASGTSTSWTG